VLPIWVREYYRQLYYIVDAVKHAEEKIDRKSETKQAHTAGLILQQ
jgi:hypothetical protein